VVCRANFKGVKLVGPTRKSIPVIVIAAIIAAAVLFVVAHEQCGKNARRAAADDATSTTSVTSPYDMTEVGGELDLNILENTTFVSILVPNADGKPTSYMADASGSGAKALIQAVCNSSELKPAPASDGLTASTLTFVLPSRQTVTFTLDLAAGLLYRHGQAWQPKGDLEALVQAATTAPE
jgi:hypothetical protein